MSLPGQARPPLAYSTSVPASVPARTEVQQTNKAMAKVETGHENAAIALATKRE